MKRKLRNSLAGDKRMAALALAISLAPPAAHAATGDLTTNTATVRADNREPVSANNVSGVTGSEGVPQNTVTNSVYVKADNKDTSPANNGGSSGIIADSPKDTDIDGIPDIFDLDDDNDGIPDTVEAATALNNGDTDNDGIPDSLDLDSDNDGILDVVEAGHTGLDANKDGRIDGAPSAFGPNGLANAVETTPESGVINYTPRDTDGDGRPDFQDLDSDNDGINDVRESNGTDDNGDGKADGAPDINGVPYSALPGGATPPDTDKDGKPDYRDLDSDNDGINDVTENGGSDPDNNGIVGSGQKPADTDKDGIPDAADLLPNTFGDASDPAPRNSDNDPIPNYRDLDSDNDGTADVIEGGNGPADTDNNGTISPSESPDGDGDGIPTAVDNDPTKFGDAGGPPPTQTTLVGPPDYINPDRDGDGIPDLIEDGHDPLLDPNGDGRIDNPVDPDDDGIPNNRDNDRDPDDFGGGTPPAPPRDTDNDKIPDAVDLDDDNDGIPDTVETVNAINNGDTDGDGVPDSLDLDSDNDGILDVVEAGHTGLDANKDGRIDGPPAAFGPNGLANVVETTPESGVINYVPRDTDGDGRPDYVDLDSDNDGINDVRESNGKDLDGDGKADGFPVNADGIPTSVPAGGATPPDTDKDGKPDYRDLDSDNDGINDVTENGGSDPDGNGIIGDGPKPTDSDSDGIPDAGDGRPLAFGDLGDPVPANGDNDPTPNYRDLDSDNDGTADVIEGGNGPADTDKNGTISPGESPDGDGDGIPTTVDNDPTKFGDAGNPPPPNTDGTGDPDYLDPDRDDDGVTDLIEDGHDPALDPNGDGRIDNPTDPDDDGIPNNGGNDKDPGNFGGATPPVAPKDTDKDNIPDVVDLDDDNDGIPDTVETANAINNGDTDGDGIPDTLDLDSDNDGILDVVEAGHTGLDANKDGRIDGLPAAFGPNGLANVVETAPESGVINYTVRDTDGDGRKDYVDLDSDNDTISDLLENGNGAITDVDHDGVADGTPNANGLIPGAGATNPQNSDTDALPDYRDVDSNNDGVKDITDNGYKNLDANGDGKIDNAADPDGDGIANVLDTKPTIFGGFPLAGCTAWNLENPADSDQDVFPKDQEYAFGGNPLLGDHRVKGTARREGLSVVKNATGGVDISFVRPRGRYDVTYTLLGNGDLGDTWYPIVDQPTVVSNGDGTDTLTWKNAENLSGMAGDDALLLPLADGRGFVRLKVETPCDPDGSYTLVQGWCREDINGKRQTYGVNFPSLPVFTGVVNSASGSTINTATSGSSQNLGAYVTGGAYYIEFTDGPAEGHRIDVTGGGTNTFTLNLGSANNTTATLPGGLAGSHYVIRKHRTLGEVFVNTEWDGSSTVGSADQVLFFNGSGYDTYFNLVNNTWVKQGAGYASQNGKIIPPGEAVFVVHADPNDLNNMIQIGEVRYNDFRRPLQLGTTGQNFVALGYPLNNTPAGLNMNVGNGFNASSTVGSATQILNWMGDHTYNATGFVTNFQIANGVWRTQGNLANVTTNKPLFEHCRGTFVDVQKDKPDWIHPLPWNPAPWLQP